MLKLVSLEYWYTQLITRFKEKTSNILQALQIDKYTTTDAQKEKSPYIYAQLLFCHIKATQITSMYN